MSVLFVDAAERRMRRAVRRRPELACWVPFLHGLEWDDRRHVQEWLIAHTGEVRLTDELRTAMLVALDHYPAGLWWEGDFAELVAAVGSGVPVSTIATWGWLRGSGEVSVSLGRCRGAGFAFPMALARGFVTDWSWPVRDALEDAWELLAEAPGCAGILRDADFQALPVRARGWLLRVCVKLKTPGDVLDALVRMEPGQREKMLERGNLRSDQASRLRTDDLPVLIRRWGGMGNSARAGLALTSELFAFMTPEECGAVAEAPEAVLTRIGKARRNRQLWYETVDGLEWLHAVMPELFLAGLLGKPEVLFTCGVRLAVYGKVRTNRLLRRLRGHVLFSFTYKGLVGLDRLLCAHRELAVTVPAFVTWDRHFAGEKVLGVAAIESVARQMLEGLAGMRLRYLMDLVDRELALFGDVHAGLLRAGLRVGRGVMVRFLREYVRGRDGRLAMEANRRWLESRPAFRLERWLRPLRITLGEVTLSVEENPFELVRVGTYARTCLAPGAMNSANAVAAMLDVNKRVIFARNGKGTFLARQIVAISEAGYFVCYPVYPEAATKELQDFFQLYVEDWALQMGTPLAHTGDPWEMQEVRGLTVERWYDDGIWERMGG